MWSKTFWQVVLEHMVRGAAVAVAAAYFSGDVVFDALNVSTWSDAGSLAIGGAIGALVLALAGNAVSGNGPSFTRQEVVQPKHKA